MRARHPMPRSSRKLTNVNGGMMSRTTLLTTYIPPQILAAVNPAKIPKARTLTSMESDYTHEPQTTIAFFIRQPKYAPMETNFLIDWEHAHPKSRFFEHKSLKLEA
jgi:hypothetical protein